MIGKLERVPLREVWKREANDFTTWLEANHDVIEEVVDIGLTGVERERSAGTFNVDLVGEDSSGSPVIIENQLEKSDHDHLGKVLTYLTSLEAKTAIWIVSEPRPEHVKAIAWLNESSPASFYLLKAEAVRIGDSPPAPLLTVIVGPSEESREVGDTKKDFAERYALRRRFWTELLKRAGERTALHGNISPSRQNWISTGAGRAGLNYNYVVRQHDARVELYIDRGKGADEENTALFQQLQLRQEDIESVYGQALDWDRVEGRRACRIAHQVDVGGYRDEDKWPAIHEAMIDAMIRLEKALSPHISKLDI